MALFTPRPCDYLSIADNAGGPRAAEEDDRCLVRYAIAKKRPQ